MMASGKPVGTAYAEIDLDTTKLEQGLKRTHDALLSGTIKVEDAYKSLGIKSDQVYNQMRANAVAAVDFIKNKTMSSKEEIIRAETAAANKIKELNQQQFGHQTSRIESLKSHWIAASAAVIAAWALVNKAVAYMDEGGKALQIESSFKIMADSAGVNSERLIASMKAATRETIDDSDLMQKAVKLMTLGYNPEQIERFSNVVITASQIAGTTAAEAYENLADAIGNRTPKALIRMGAVTREQMEIVNKAINEGADQMALYELAMANLELKQKMLQGTQDQATIALQRFHTQVKETQENLGKGLIVIVTKLYGVFQAAASGALALYGGLLKIAQGITVLESKVSFGDYKKFLELKAKGYGESAETAFLAMEELNKRAEGNILGTAEAGEKSTPQSIAAAQAKVDSLMANFKAIAGKKDTEKEVEALRKRQYEALKKQEEMMAQDTAEAWKYYYEFVMEEEKKGAKETEDLRKQEYESLKKQEEMRAQDTAEAWKYYYDYVIAEQKQYEKESEELTKQQYEALKKQNDMMAEDTKDAWKYYYEYIMEEQKKADKALEDQAKKIEEIGSSVSGIWSNHIASMLKGTETFGEGVKGIFTDMADYVIQMITKMMMNYALFGNMAGTLGTGGLFGLFGKIGGVSSGGSASAAMYNYAEGTNFIPENQFAFLHKGEAVIPAAYNQGKGGGGGNQPIIYNDNRVTNYNDFVDAHGIERIMPAVIGNMKKPKYRDAMKNITRSSL